VDTSSPIPQGECEFSPTLKKSAVSRIRKITNDARKSEVEESVELSNDSTLLDDALSLSTSSSHLSPLLSVSMIAHRFTDPEKSFQTAPTPNANRSVIDTDLQNVIQQTQSMMEAQGVPVSSTASNSPSIPRCLSVKKEADTSWQSYLKRNDSIITDIFGGQLQSCIECLTCNHRYRHTYTYIYYNAMSYSSDILVLCRSMCFDPYLDLSIPITSATTAKHSSSESSSGMWNRWNNTKEEPPKCSLENCLETYTSMIEVVYYY
jgi:hypothetical protein